MNPQELTGWEKLLIYYVIPMAICLVFNLAVFLIEKEPPDDMMVIAPFVPFSNLIMAMLVTVLASVAIPVLVFFVAPCLAIKKISEYSKSRRITSV